MVGPRGRKDGQDHVNRNDDTQEVQDQYFTLAHR